METAHASFYRMKIRELTLAVRLGCEPDERAHRQEVRVQVDLRFRQRPLGADNDNLADTLCYAKISESIKHHGENQEFRLIEKMAQDFYGIVSQLIEHRAQVMVTVHKMKPPVPGLNGGVEFSVGDF